MKNILKYSILLLVFTATKAIAQTPVNIVKKDTVITGNLTLVATQSIILKPNTHIVEGSNFVAKINSDTNPVPNIPVPYSPISSSNENYIYTRKFQNEMTTASDIKNNNDVIESIVYFDGLGRPVQSIAIKASPSNQDIVSHIDYDGFGRQVKDYLPYLDTSGANASYRTNGGANTNSYYSLHYPLDINNGDPNPFSQKKLENSSLNRVLKQAAPGTSWKMDGGHEIKLDYQTNLSADAVKLYKASTTWQADKGLYNISFSDEGTYTEKELYKNVTYDENSNANPTEAAGATVEFKNKEGQVVLKRTYDAGDKHDTYYVYDMYGNLAYVIPPKVSGAITDDVLNGLCYQYKYDYRNRLVEKKLPGKQWEFIVYDKLDRPVATGPAFSPFKDNNSIGWLITKYDAFNRPVYTGWNGDSSNSATRKSLQDAQNTATGSLFETKEASGIVDDIHVSYSNTVVPTNFKLLTVTYYDDYTFDGAPTVPASIEDQTVLTNAKGLSTGNWIRVVTTPEAALGEKTIIFYDEKARPIQTKLENHLSGHTITTSKLDFTGKAIYTVTQQKRTSGDNELTVREDFTYSPQDRLLTHTHQINGGAIELLANNTYDDLGHLIIKNVGSSIGNPLQKVHFTYNIRGWLTGINETENLQHDSDAVDLFAFKINYNNQPVNPDVKSLYNGNIAETFWKTASDPSLRAYGYKYDDLNRLKDALYRKPNDAIPASGAYNESLSYDKNGNIKSLNRYGGSDAPSIVFKIDDLKYDYVNENSNQLAKVTENPAGNDNAGFKDGNQTGDDYTYDANGNMIIDKNKNITQITYNQLNLPKKIIFGTTGSIEYIYNATGQKQRKIVTEGTTVISTDYLGGYQYKDNVLQFFPTAEGYVKNDNGALSYVFQYKDHLGNVRVSYAKNPQTQVLEIIEENNYYPFGLKHEGYNPPNVAIGNIEAQKYKYNGKELQDELGLNMYDYGARNYDPALGRWMNIDPLAEKMRRWSPYNYCFNNPLRFIDPDGMGPQWIVGTDGQRVSHTVNKDGSLKWSSNASADTQRLGNALNLTTAGRDQLNQLENSDTKVSVSISSADKSEKTKEGTDRTFGETIQGNNKESDNYGRIINSDGTFGIKEASIVIFEGSIKQGIKEGSGSRLEGLSTEQAIGAIGGHEIVHATDKKEINKDIKYEQKGGGKTRPGRENLTNKIESLIRLQSSQFKSKL